MEQKLDCDMRHFNLINQELYCDASGLIQLSKSLTVTLVINLTEQELDCDAKGWTCFCTWCFYTSVDNIAFGTVHIRISISIYRWCRGKTAYPTFSRFQDAVIINLFLTGTLSFGIRGFVFQTVFFTLIFHLRGFVASMQENIHNTRFDKKLNFRSNCTSALFPRHHRYISTKVIHNVLPIKYTHFVII